MTIRAGDEAGAFNGFLSLASVVAAEGSTRWLRAATTAYEPTAAAAAAERIVASESAAG